MIITAEQLDSIREQVRATYPDVAVVYMKKDSYCDRHEDMFYLYQGDIFFGAVNVKDTTAYLIIQVVKAYTYAYDLAARRT